MMSGEEKMTGTEETYHVPVLLEEALGGLRIKAGGVYVDATFGGGGHSRGILGELDATGRLFGFDQDRDAMANATDDERFTFVLSNFRYIRNFLRFYGAGRADGVLADLGVSSHHFDTGERGFSFRQDGPLDMRMNRMSGITAKDIVNGYDEKRLKEIFSTYGEIKHTGPLVRGILKARERKEIETTQELADAAGCATDPRHEKRDLARIFQALRIEVNGEMDSLRIFLESLPEILKRGGRAAIITYHSLEDRMVKNFFRSGSIGGEVEKDFYGNVRSPFKVLTRTPITASAEEVERNPRSRSAKLRIAELV